MAVNYDASTVPQAPVRSWLRYALMALSVEKLIQHCFVTVAFVFNLGNIRSQVVVSPTILAIAGGIVAVLFALALWGLLRRRAWPINLLLTLAVFDLVGEFVAQGRADITITVSFLVAGVLLVLSLLARRQTRRPLTPATRHFSRFPKSQNPH